MVIIAGIREIVFRLDITVCRQKRTLIVQSGGLRSIRVIVVAAAIVGYCCIHIYVCTGDTKSQNCFFILASPNAEVVR
ncbi:hypothetical protein [Candidatus Endomicrobiellum agilis]|uniref:hypothetical protein n=1 Tax=Candidatus Endomicrobiellum agilis TaxID=3238957 RepID=UPI003583729F|nr:hypothetical protein [Endomicrobium sp.]